jgi:hypothetical protein
MVLLDQVCEGEFFNAILPHKKERRYWLERFRQAADHKREIWDYQWTFAMWTQNSMAIIPEVNLISNIGYNEQGTHTKSEKDLFANLPMEAMRFPLKHPKYMIRNHVADKFTTDIAFIHSKLHAVKFMVRKWLLQMEKTRQHTVDADRTE